MTPSTIGACTGCGDCLSACPQRILLVAEGRVAIDFSRGECTFCNACAQACPEPVFTAVTAMVHVARIGESCLAYAGIACMTCRDACPDEAIRLSPVRGGVFLPDLAPEACSGCGACVAPCPTQAITMHPLLEACDA